MENSEFDSCVVFPLEYVALDQTVKAEHKTLRISGKRINMGSVCVSLERVTARLVETAHRMGINVVIGSIHCPWVIRRDYMPYLENVVPEMDLVIADRGEDVQIRTPAGKLLAEKPWKDISENPLISLTH